MGGESNAAWVDLCGLEELTPGQGRYLEHAGRALALFRLPGEPARVVLMDDRCPHAGGSLSGGRLDEAISPGATCVICPWHGWPFQVDGGACPDNPAWRVATHDVRVVEGRVQGRL